MHSVIARISWSSERWHGNLPVTCTIVRYQVLVPVVFQQLHVASYSSRQVYLYQVLLVPGTSSTSTRYEHKPTRSMQNMHTASYKSNHSNLQG